MVDITSHNLRTVEEFADMIRENLKASTENWWTIALAFTDAREMYGSDSDRFKNLIKMTNFSRAKVSKLITIATSERLRQYTGKLSAVLSWGTLYAITTLNDEQFQKLKTEKGLDNTKTPPAFISQNEVERLKKGKSVKSALKNFLSVQVDEDALLGGLITGDDWEALMSLVNQLEAVSSYIKVRVVDLNEKEAARETTRLANKVAQLSRREFQAGIDAVLKRYKKYIGEKQDVYERRVLPMSRAELSAEFYRDPRSAFALLGLEYDEAGYYRSAQKAISAAADRHANNAIQRVESSYGDSGASEKLAA